MVSMNEKCKYCNYVSKCSQFCEYNSVICKLHRSFPKIVDKSYEELEKENQQLKSQLKQRNEVIVEAIKAINESEEFQILEAMALNIDQAILMKVLSILYKYKGDSNE